MARSIPFFLVLCLLGGRLGTQETLDRILPVRGLCMPAPRPGKLDEFLRFVDEELAPRSVNTLMGGSPLPWSRHPSSRPIGDR